MKYCIYTKCFEGKELAAALEILKGVLVAIAILAFSAAFLIPEEQEFFRLGYSSMARHYLLAAILPISLGIFGALAVKKSSAWCRPCKELGKPLCYLCGTPFLVEREYRLEQFLLVVVFVGLIGRCPCCGISFPVKRQQ